MYCGNFLNQPFFLWWWKLMYTKVIRHDHSFTWQTGVKPRSSDWWVKKLPLSKNASSAQSLSHVRLFVTPWTTARQSSLSITNSGSLLKLMSIELVIPSNHLVHHHPLLLQTSIFPNIRVFSNESVLHIRWPKYRSFSFSISPSNEYSGLISFRIDWFYLLEVQGTSKSLFQHQSWKS